MKFGIRGKDVRICELVRRYELDPIELESGPEVLHFRYVISIYRDLDGEDFFPKVYRYEFFRLQVSDFKDVSSGEYCDEELLIEDTSQAWEDIRESSESGVLKCVLLKLKGALDNNDVGAG